MLRKWLSTHRSVAIAEAQVSITASVGRAYGFTLKSKWSELSDAAKAGEGLSVVSLHATKVLGIGEGGFVMSRDPAPVAAPAPGTCSSLPCPPRPAAG